MKKGKIHWLYLEFWAFDIGLLVSIRDGAMSIEAIEDLRLEAPMDTSSGVVGGVEARAGRPKNAPIRSCD